MDNVIKANIKSQDKTAFTRSVWQYDYGQILQITGVELPPAVEVQFALAEKSGETITRVANTVDGVTEVQIPNELLKRDGCMGDYFIYAFIFVSNKDSGNTKYEIQITVKKRPKPEEPTDEPEQEENLFHATVVAVNASADRAETAEKNAKESAEKAETTLTEMKATADTLTETVEQAEKLDGNLDKKLEQGENIVANIKDKLDAPENPMVGKYLRVKAVNEDGVPELEWVDEPSGGSSLDIQINGQSIVKDGIAEIPLCTESRDPGLITIDVYSNNGGLYRVNNATGLIRIAKASDNSLAERTNECCPVVPRNLDYAVKAAMCDGKGADWTLEEQASARERMGIDEYEDVLDVTLEEDSSFSADFEHEYKQLYIYIDQSGVTEKIYVIYLYPYSYVNGEGKKINTFGSYYPPASKSYPNVASVWKSYGKVTTRIASVTNDQKNTTGNQTTCLKVWDTSMLNINGIGDPFKGIYPSGTILKAGTRIVVKGVRA